MESSQSVSHAVYPHAALKEAALTENLMLSRHCAGDAWRAPFLQQRRGKPPSQQCIPTGCANVSTKPRGLGPSRLPELSRLWPWTKHSGNWQSRPTISLRLRLQGRPNGRVLCPRLAPDKSSPFSFVPLPEQHRCGRPPSSVQFHPA